MGWMMQGGRDGTIHEDRFERCLLDLIIDDSDEDRAGKFLMDAINQRYVSREICLSVSFFLSQGFN